MKKQISQNLEWCTVGPHQYTDSLLNNFPTSLHKHVVNEEICHIYNVYSD